MAWAVTVPDSTSRNTVVERIPSVVLDSSVDMVGAVDPPYGPDRVDMADDGLAAAAEELLWMGGCRGAPGSVAVA